ncbi:FAD-dependent oxidoreductase [Cellulomonas oligotrophica]|uniref:N-acylamino acid racemase n=2 Tax=Cellulomonas oligotrophica TaxID=931536 RepID=A0ABQ4DAG6_9CELL|nr:N-acylamino acid racemase [Cellulomonas oligotrophica]
MGLVLAVRGSVARPTVEAMTSLATPTETFDVVLVGAGMASDAAARGIRELDADATIAVVGREDTAPVERPALSKGLWTDPETTLEGVALGTAEATGATLLLGTSVVAVDTAARTVTTDDGRTLGYGRLLLATGGRPVHLPGVEESGRVLYYRSVRDYERLREVAGQGRHVVVVGGGYIGTEVAAALAQNDTRVTLVVSQDVLQGHVFPAALAARVDQRYVDAGVALVRGARLASADAGPDAVRVHLQDGRTIDADALVVGVGIEVETDLAQAAGITVDDGVVVDEQLRTSAADVWAAGDLAQYPDRLLGRRRVEHVDHAQSSGRQAGRNIAGAGEPYTHTPFYYSDLFELGYEAVGRLDASLDTVEDWHGDEPYAQGVVYYLDGGRVAGVLLWDVWDRTDAARDVIAHQTDVSPEALRGRITA